MKITIVGCGNMGMIYARSFLKYGLVVSDKLLLVEKSEARRDELSALNIGKVTIPDDVLVQSSDIIILAVKPQDFDELAPILNKVISSNNLVISIMAGITIPFIEQALGTYRMVRAMPNSPAQLGMGITGYSCSDQLSREDILLAENLLSTTGRSIYFKEEHMLNAVTAISGSGPAYFFYIVKYMVEASKQLGIAEHIANNLVMQTMLGAFHVMNEKNKTLDELIEAVSSKGGTTEAAFRVFSEAQLGENLAKGILQACHRAEELAK